MSEDASHVSSRINKRKNNCMESFLITIRQNIILVKTERKSKIFQTFGLEKSK